MNTEWQNTAKVDKYRQNTMATVVFEKVSQNAKNLFDRKKWLEKMYPILAYKYKK